MSGSEYWVLMMQRRLVAKAAAMGMLVIAGAVVALALAELGARLLPTPYEYSPSYHCDRWVGWLGAPGLSLIETIEDYAHQVTRNSRGMHDGEHALFKPEGVFRILVLGDSFVDAREVEEAQTSHQVLEDQLNARAPDGLTFEVILTEAKQKEIKHVN